MCVIFAAQFYVYYGVRRVLNRIIKESLDKVIVEEAVTANGKSARVRLKWLRNNKSNLSVDNQLSIKKILWMDTLSVSLFGVLVLLWVIAFFID